MKKILSLTITNLIFISVTLAQIPSYVPSNGLVSWWPFNGNANDESGNNYHGIVNGATPTSDRNANINSAYLFDGINDWINIGSTNDLEITGDITVSAWVKTPSSWPTTYHDPQIYSRYTYSLSTPTGINFYLNDPHLSSREFAFILKTGSNSWGNDFATSSTILQLNTWYFVVGVRENNLVKIYVNGVLEGTDAGSSNPINYGASPIASIGEKNGDSPGFFDGVIDDVAVWNRSLSVQEIITLYNGKGVLGFVYNDLNSNCIQDSSEIGLANRLGIIQPGNIMIQTTTDGSWQIDSLAPDNYTITIDTSGKWETSCLITQNFTVIDSDSLTIAPAFGLTNTEPCAEPTVSVHMPFIRRCFTNQKIYIQACNTDLATGILNNAYVDLELDSLITPVANSASDISFTDLGNNVYRFNIGSLNPGQCFDFWLATDVNCAASLGQTLCVDANLLPADSCVFDQIPSSPVGGVQPCTLPWDKSSLSVNGWCQNDSVYFSITNTGSAINGNMQCYSPVRVYVDGILTYIDSVMLGGGETIIFSYPGNGQTWILQADQHPLHPGNSNPNDHVEACGNLSNWTPGLVNTMPLDDADPVIDIYCGVVTGSYDPNDKTGYPLGVGNDHLISPNGKLDYVIRFQNTGTDTAFTVVVRDTLDIDLDIFSTKSGISSHNYSFKMYGPRILEWTFNNIMLPDSASDQEGSNGFITFTVLQNPELPNGTVINNRVGIYFDFNDPIITNTTTHTINREVFITTSSPQISKANNFMIIYPNPVSQILNIILDDNQPLNIEIYSVDGKIMHQEKINRNTSINMNKYPAGLYFIKGINEKGDLFQNKFIKN